MTQDVLTDVFQTLRVSGAEYARFESHSPWAVDVRSVGVVRFYAVLAGDCRLELGDDTPLMLSPGDLVVLPHPVPHTIRSGASAHSMYPESVLESQGLSGLLGSSGSSGSSGLSLSGLPGLSRPGRLAPNEDPASHCIISGRFSFEQSARQHWWPLLPSVIAVRGRAHTLPWLESTLRFIASESDSQRPGTQTLVTRLTDLLMFQVIREYLVAAVPQDTGSPSWLAALSEPQIGAALAMLHENPQEVWT